MKSIVTRVTANGIEHGLIRRFGNEDRTDGFANMKEDVKQECLKKQKDDATIVRMRYKNKDPGGYLEMPFCLGGSFPIEYWRFIDEYIYDVSKGLVRQVNQTQFISRKQEEGHEEIKGNLFNTQQVGMDEKVVGKVAEHRFYPVGDF